ncbi:MAG: SAM-dependent methyltransferase [Labedaea sp.]
MLVALSARLRLGRASADRNGGRALEHMTGDPNWELPPIDLTVAHPARMHNYWLGGGLNFAVDRDLATKITQIFPGIEDVARINQSFLRRAVLYMADAGIRQFLDIGSGLPNVGMVHEIVEQIRNCRVVYVDPDPVAVAYSERLLKDRGWAAALQADVRDVSGVFNAEPARRLLHPEQPIGLIAPMLHFLPDRLRPADVVAGYRDRLAPGSYLVIAHATGDGDPPGLAEVVAAYRGSRFPAYLRTHEQIIRLCHGFDLVEPGLVRVNEWRPQGPGDASANPQVNSLLYGAVGRKP